MAAWIYHAKSCLVLSNLQGQGETASIGLIYSDMCVYRYQIPQCGDVSEKVGTYIRTCSIV